MTSDSQSFDPYRSPTMPEVPYSGHVERGRPGLLTALCVVAIVLGGMGMVNALMGAGAAIAGERLQAVLQPAGMPGSSPEMQQVQRDFQNEVNAIQRRYFMPMVVMLLFRFVAALLLLLGGLRALNLQESGRKLLIVALCAAAAFELANAVIQTIVNMETMTAVNGLVDKMVQTMPQGQNAPPGMQSVLQTVVRGSIIAGLVFFYILVLVKLVIYLGGVVYLQKERIRSRFQSAA